jgi:hypothetical protein
LANGDGSRDLTGFFRPEPSREITVRVSVTGEQRMIPQKEPEMNDVILQVLLAGEIFIQPEAEELRKCHVDILRNLGIFLKKTDFQILDHSHAANSSIVIGRYSLEYEKSEGDRMRNYSVEGVVTLQADKSGNMSLKISTRPDRFCHDTRAIPAKRPAVQEET